MGFVSKEHICLQQGIQLLCLLLEMSGSFTWCRGLPGLCRAGNPASLQSKEEMQEWQFLKLTCEKGGKGSFFLTGSSIDFKIFLFHYELEVSFLVFSLVTETTKYTVHSPVPINYRYHLRTCMLQGYILFINQVSGSVKNGETQSKTLEINFQTL